MKERLQWVDIAKGMTIVFVVLGHVVSSYHEAGFYKDSVLFNFSSQFVYSFHMAVFMLLSGYLVKKGKRKGTNLNQILQKIINYGIPYVVFSCVWVFMKMIMSGQTNSKVGIGDLLLIPIYPISFMWFIYALMLMQIIQVFITNNSIIFKVCHLSVALVGYFIRPYLIDAFSLCRFSDSILSDFLKMYFFFLAGVYLVEFVISAFRKYQLSVTIVFGFLLILGNVVIYNGMIAASNIINLLLAIIGSCFIIEMCILIKKCRFLEYLGRQTLPIYVLHGIAIAATRLLLTELNLNIFGGAFPLIVCTISGCFVPLCVYWICKRIWKLDAFFYPGKYFKLSNRAKNMKTL